MCCVDKKFLEFFFKRVKLNTTGQYESEFPYVSPCGREINYIHCDDLPIVFSQLLDSANTVIDDVTGYGNRLSDETLPESETMGYRNAERTTKNSNSLSRTATNAVAPPSIDASNPPPAGTSLAYGGTLSLTFPFQPSSLCMLPASGRVYHAGPDKLGGVGLVKSSLAIELSRFFVYEEGAGESAHPVGFRWRGETWELDTAVLARLTKLTSIND